MPILYEILENNFLYGKSNIHVIIDNNNFVWFNDILLALCTQIIRMLLQNILMDD